MRTSTKFFQRAISLAEVAVVMAILAVLLAIVGPAYFRYRGHQAVNTGAEILEGYLIRGREEAKSVGYPLSDELRTNGISNIADPGPFGADSRILLRLRKRYRAGQPAQTMSVRDLSSTAPVEIQLSQFGNLDIDADPSMEGVFFELLEERNSGKTVLLTMPIDSNGEFFLQGKSADGTLRIFYGDYSRTVTVTHRGVITPDQR